MAVAAFEGMAAIFAQHLGEHGPILYAPAVGAAFTLPPGRAIYREQAIDGFADDDSAGVDNVLKSLHLQEADVAAPAEGDRVTVRGVTYRVTPPIARDGNGMVIVTLKKV